MSKCIAILSTLDTKGAEAAYMRDEVERLGGKALLIDLGIIGTPQLEADISREQIIAAGGGDLAELLKNPTRQAAAPLVSAGATLKLQELIASGRIHGVVGLGGTQGTTACCEIMRTLPYGFPKVMLSTIASGDTSPFIDIKDITMMFSVGDILGLNPVLRRMLANAVGAAWGMAQVETPIATAPESKGTVGLTNLGVLTRGAMHAIDLLHEAGYEVITFHAVGSGGRAMEQMMREGLITAVFDYALGEIADEVFDGLRAADAERLTTAGKLGLPQVICPGGAEHIGLLLSTPNEVPDEWKDHKYNFHSPVIFAPRLNVAQLKQVAGVITDRLQHSKDKTVFLIPHGGVSSYSAPGAPLEDREGDAAFFAALKNGMPDTVHIKELPYNAEEPAFVESAVKQLIELIEN